MRSDRASVFGKLRSRFSSSGYPIRKAAQTKLSLCVLYLLPALPMCAVWLADTTQRQFIIWSWFAIVIALMHALGRTEEQVTHLRLKGLTTAEIIDSTLSRRQLGLIFALVILAAAWVMWTDPAYLLGIVIFVAITAVFIGFALPDIGQDDIGVGRKFLSSLLDIIPAVLIAAAMIFTSWVLTDMREEHVYSDMAWLCIGAAIALSCLSPVAHTLAHGGGYQRCLAKVFFAVVGYPHFVHEHAMLHGSGRLRTKNCSIGSTIGESFYNYARRRIPRGWKMAREWQALRSASGSIWERHEIACWCVVSAVAAAACALYAGAAGAVFWLLACVCMHWSIQATNYLRHWGLKGRSLNQGATGTVVWEMSHRWDELISWDRSEGTAHFRSPQAPYYAHKAVNERTAPIYPYSGFVMRFVVLIPRAHLAFSLPVLKAWRKTGGRRGTILREQQALKRLHERRLRSLPNQY